MPSVVKVRCPGCRSLLRIPAEWLSQPIRCKHCSKSFRAKAKSPNVSSDAPAPLPAPSVVPAAPPVDPVVLQEAAAPAAPEFAFGTSGLSGTNPIGAVASFRRAQSSPAQKVVLAGIGLALLGLAIGAGVYIQGLVVGARHAGGGQSDDAPKVVEATKAKNVPPPDKASETPREVFPRRFLAITIHQYLYANSTSPFAPSLGPGHSRRLLANALRDLAQNQLRVSPGQVYVLSDALTGAGYRPPLKPVIEQTVERFLATSRPQDRVMLVFVGHAIDIDDQPYLVPLEGELAVQESLIPLKWLYDRLAICPARQKVLVIDAGRYDSTRGLERPGSGPMGPRLDAALAEPPPGVQVWTACTAGQFSYEYDYATRGNAIVEGGAFSSLLTLAFQQGGGVPKPDDPLPLSFLADAVSGPLRELTLAREKVEQTARLSGQETATGAVYAPQEPMPARFELPQPASPAKGGLADPKMVEAIFAEVAVPPLKLPRDQERVKETPDQQAARLAAIFPFGADVLEPYAADYKHLREVMTQPRKFPLRVTVVRAVDALDRQGRLNRVKLGDKEETSDRLIEEFRGRTTDQVKKSLTESQQRGPARMLVELEDVLEEMQKVGAKRDQEPSKRWQAHYDYVLAQLKARIVYLHEYDTMLGKVKRDELPPLDPALHNGWRLSAQEKIQSSKDVKDLASDAKKLLNKIIQDYPGTPWEILAKRERFTALGLAWQPARFGN